MSKHHQNARRFFVTAKKEGPLLRIVSETLGDRCDPISVIESGGVWLDRERMTDPHRLIAEGETLRVYFSPFQTKKYSLPDDRVIYEDAHVLIIDKPAGVTSVADRSDRFYNVTYGVHQYLLAKGLKINYAPITRLDFMVGGLMLFAKTPDAVRQLSQKIQKREIYKMYEAVLCPHEGLPQCLRVKDFLHFAGKAFEDAEQGRFAHSLFMRAPGRGGCPVYRVVLYSGRRHQIRYHAARYLSPVMGDDLYGPGHRDGEDGSLGISLRSVGLNFWLFGKRYRVRCQAPE